MRGSRPLPGACRKSWRGHFVAATVGLILNALQSFLKDKLGFLGALLGGHRRGGLGVW